MNKSNKKISNLAIIVSFVLFFTSYDLGAQWKKQEFIANPEVCEKILAGGQKYQSFLCIGSDLKRTNHPESDGLIIDSWCPESTKYGHVFVMIDSTEGYSPSQYTELLRRLLDKENIEFIAPYDKFSIMNVDGMNQSSAVKPLFSDCKPRSSYKGTMYPINEYISRKDAPLTLEGNFIEFEDLLEKNTDPLSSLNDVKGQYSQLFEFLKELGLRLDLDFQSDYQYRKIIIFSDMLQHSRNMSFLKDCRPTEIINGKSVRLAHANKDFVKGKCKTFNEYKSQMNENKWNTTVPNFGINPPEVFVYYLNCRHDPDLDIGLIEVWEDFFSEIGIKMQWDGSQDCEGFKKVR